MDESDSSYILAFEETVNKILLNYSIIIENKPFIYYYNMDQGKKKEIKENIVYSSNYVKL